jgi:hypothetical protein
MFAFGCFTLMIFVKFLAFPTQFSTLKKIGDDLKYAGNKRWESGIIHSKLNPISTVFSNPLFQVRLNDYAARIRI